LDKKLPRLHPPQNLGVDGHRRIEPADVLLADVRVHKDQMFHKKAKASTPPLLDLPSKKVEGCIVAVALAQAALDEALNTPKPASPTAKPISDMQGIRFELADCMLKSRPAAG